MHVQLKPQQGTKGVQHAGRQSESAVLFAPCTHSHTQIVTHSLTVTRTHTKPFKCDAQGDRVTMVLLLLIGRLIPRNATD